MSTAAVAEPGAGAKPPRSAIPNPTLDGPLALLGTAVAATALGMTVAAFRGDGTALNAFLFTDLGFSHSEAAQCERGAVSVTWVFSIAALVWRRWPLLLPAAFYFFAEALARTHVQGEAYSDWALLTHAARYVTPLTMALLLLGTNRDRLRRWSAAGGRWALRIALAAVFASHGFEALRANPAFVDFIISTAANLFQSRITETNARSVLELIGVMDVVVAGAFLLRLHPALLGWAALWGAVTALSRVTANGWGAYPDVLVRASYFLGPVALWLLVSPGRDRQESPAMPARRNTADANPGGRPTAASSSLLAGHERVPPLSFPSA